MKYFVFADVHGYYSLLIKELENKGFNVNNEEHMLISLGDNFDRGPENYEMFLFLKEMYNKNKIILVKGNHEDIFLNMIMKGYPSETDKLNGTYGTLNELYQKYFETEENIKYAYILETYHKLKEVGFISLIYNMLDYYETKNYIFTHGFIPIDEVNNQYNNNWRDSSYKEFQDSRWTNGIEKSIKYKIGEPNKKIVIGHFHASYGNVRKDANDLPEGILKKLEFSSLDLFEPYIDERIIAIDGCTHFTKKVNVVIIED